MPVPRAHHLNVARPGAAFVAQAVAVGDRAAADECHDFHIVVRVRIEAGSRRDSIVVPHPNRAPTHACGIVIARETEVMTGIEPAVVGMAKPSEGTKFNHGIIHLGGELPPE